MNMLNVILSLLTLYYTNDTLFSNTHTKTYKSYPNKTVYFLFVDSTFMPIKQILNIYQKQHPKTLIKRIETIKSSIFNNLCSHGNNLKPVSRSDYKNYINEFT